MSATLNQDQNSGMIEENDHLDDHILNNHCSTTAEITILIGRLVDLLKGRINNFIIIHVYQ
jgi:hypothetical protein